MKLFTCTHCGQLLYFENNQCEQCRYPLGFVTATLRLEPLVAWDNTSFKLYTAGDRVEREDEHTLYQWCDNHQYGVCNWLVPKGSTSPYCEACQLNGTIPDLSKPAYVERWQVLEKAKHRLVYSLLRMHLPLISKHTNEEEGLIFNFLADESKDPSQRILTGHANGVITINIAEADDIEREMARKAMEEPYRTVLGHFRHEIAHYYWQVLIENSPYLEGFRQLFGDERADYGQALQTHYSSGPAADWRERFISAYAASHPWEDWAETFAHYLHIMDTLETAYAFGLSVQPTVLDKQSELSVKLKKDPYELEDFTKVISWWLPISFAMNSLNRSMGLNDPYPFVIPPKVIEKLGFIHSLCLRFRHNLHVVSQPAYGI